MRRFKMTRYLICLFLLIAFLAGSAGGQVLATQENGDYLLALPLNQADPEDDDPTTDKGLELRCDYPLLLTPPGEPVEFELELLWGGGERRQFDLEATPLEGWKSSIFTLYGGFPEKPIPSIEVEPDVFFGNKVKIRVEPVAGNIPDVGDYVVTFIAKSDDIKASFDLVTRVIAQYEFGMIPATGRLATEVNAGEDNHISVVLINAGSAGVEDLVLTATKPEGWTVSFNPERVPSLPRESTIEVDVNINPSEGTDAGDWPLILHVEGPQVADELEFRVTVASSGILGWIIILIALAAIAAIVVALRYLGRRRQVE